MSIPTSFLAVWFPITSTPLHTTDWAWGDLPPLATPLLIISYSLANFKFWPPMASFIYMALSSSSFKARGWIRRTLGIFHVFLACDFMTAFTAIQQRKKVGEHILIFCLSLYLYCFSTMYHQNVKDSMQNPFKTLLFNTTLD